MEKNLQESQSISKQSQSLQISPRIKEIGREISHVNQLTSFLVPAEILIDWAKSIEEIVPNLDIEDLKSVIVDFKIGELEYNQKEGVQNIFFGLKTNFGGKYFPKKY